MNSLLQFTSRMTTSWPRGRCLYAPAGRAAIGSLDEAAKTGSLLFGLSLALILLFWIFAGGSELRYILFAVPLPVAVAWILSARGDPLLSRRGLFAVGLFGTLAAASTMVNGTTPFTGRDLLVIGVYLSLFCFILQSERWHAGLGMAGLAAGLFLEGLLNGATPQLSLVDSTGVIESSLALPLGLFVLYYYRAGDVSKAVIASVLLFLAFKRITFLAVAVAIALDLFYTRILGRHSISRVMCIAVMMLVTLVALNLQTVFVGAQEIFNDGDLSANRLTLGRYDIGAILWEKWRVAGPLQVLFGSGVGATDAALAQAAQGSLAHNDWLKILIDYGIIGIAGFWAILIAVFKNGRLSNLFLIYTAVLMMTDNPLIYIFYFMFAHQILQVQDSEDSSIPARNFAI
jgi:hypothetical protein